MLEGEKKPSLAETYPFLAQKLLGVEGIGSLEIESILMGLRTNRNLEKLEHCWVDETPLMIINEIVLPGTALGKPAVKFLTDKHCVEMYQKFLDPNFWEKYSPNEFQTIRSDSINSSPASVCKAYVDLIENEAVFAWMGNDRANAHRLVEGAGAYREAFSLLKHGKLDEALLRISFEDFMATMAVFDVVDILNYPEATLKLKEIVIEQGNWAKNLYHLNMLFYDLELVGFDTKKLESLMFGEYKKILTRQIANKDMLDEYEVEGLENQLWMLKNYATDYASKREIDGIMRATMLRTELGAKRLRGNVARASREDWSRKWSERIDNLDIEWLESSDNPMQRYIPLLGYEIEFENTSVGGSIYNLAQMVGFKRGDGDSGDHVGEVSPGPFAHHKTAGLTFLSYLQSGLVDVDSYYDQSVHLNIGLADKVGVISFMRFLQLTGLAYNPIFTDQTFTGVYKQEEGPHSLRIFVNKQSGHGQYIECKEFSLMSPTDFMRFLRYSQMIGTGLMAWQSVNLEYFPKKFDLRDSELEEISAYRDVTTELFWSSTLEEKLKMIRGSTGVDAIQKELAYTYVRSMHALKDGLASVDLDQFLKGKVPTKISSTVVSEVQEIFPDVFSRMTSDALKKKTENEITYAGITFPNIVDFARFVALKTAGGIEKILEKGEREFAAALGNAWTNKDMKQMQRVLKQYKHLVRIDKLPEKERGAKILRLIRRYKSIGWI